MKSYFLAIAAVAMIATSCSKDELAVPNTAGSVTARSAEAKAAQAPTQKFLKGVYVVKRFVIAKGEAPELKGMMIRFNEGDVLEVTLDDITHTGTWVMDINNGSVNLTLPVPQGHPLERLITANWIVTKTPEGMNFDDPTPHEPKRIIMAYRGGAIPHVKPVALY